MPTINVNYLPQFNPETFSPEFDPTGEAAANLITGEQHTITAANGRDQHFIVPLFAPFFNYTGALVLVHTPPTGPNRTLVEGVDYYPSFNFIGASRGTAKPIYGGISFLNNQLTGIITIAYRTLGGSWCVNRSEINAILNDLVVNPRVTAWEEVVDRPVLFPPIEHEWHLQDMVGMSEVVESIESVAEAIANRPAPILNPPGVDPTKATVGLGNVDNYYTATDAEAIAGTADDLFVTPSGVKAAIDYYMPDDMFISADDANRATLGSDSGVYVPELQISPAEYYFRAKDPLSDYLSAPTLITTEDFEIEFAQAIGSDVGQLFTNQGDLPDLETNFKDHLVGAINEVLETSRVRTIKYDDRDILRQLTPNGEAAIVVENLGLFTHVVGSDEPDDDESCFATQTGRWLLQAAAWDLIDAWNSGKDDLADRQFEALNQFKNLFLMGVGTSDIAAVAADSSVSFLVNLPGASINNVAVFAQTRFNDARLHATARVAYPDVVEITVHNPSDDVGTLIVGQQWKVFVMNAMQ